MEQKLLGNNWTVEQAQQALVLIQNSNKIALLTHIQPDPDGMAACAALEEILLNMHKQVQVIYPNKSDYTFSLQPKNVFIGKHQQIPDLIISLDVSTTARFYFTQEFKDVNIINIDHHLDNNILGTFNFVNPQASSACEELFVLLFTADKKLITKKIAEMLMLGILFDSNFFTTASTTNRTLHTAAILADIGANVNQLKDQLQNRWSPQILRLWGRLLSQIKTTENQICSWISVSSDELQAEGFDKTAVTGLSDFFASICTTDVTILFYELEDGTSKASLKSKKTDVKTLAAQLGGGGHANASGINKQEPLDEFTTEVLALFTQITVNYKLST